MTTLKLPAVPIAIVAHPSRRALANRLAAQVQADAICWDMNKIGCTRNHLQAWDWLATSGAPYGVVLEDDVIPCRDFRTHLNQVIAHTSDMERLVSLYLGRGRPIEIQERIASVITSPVSFLTFNALFSTQGYIMPTSWFPRQRSVLRAIADGLTAEHAISRMVTSRRGKNESQWVTYCRQSLVDHIDGPTLIEDHGDGQPRNSTTNLVFADCDPSGAALPEIRKAWMIAGPNTVWKSTRKAIPLLDS